MTVLYIPYKAHEYYGCIPHMKHTKSLLGISWVSVSDWEPLQIPSTPKDRAPSASGGWQVQFWGRQAAVPLSL